MGSCGVLSDKDGKKDAISKALNGVNGDTPTLVKEGLKRLQRL